MDSCCSPQQTSSPFDFSRGGHLLKRKGGGRGIQGQYFELHKPVLKASHLLCSLLYSLAARRAGKWYSYDCLSRSAHRAFAQQTKQTAGEHMELIATQQERPWDRPFWKPVHGKEGVFAYLVLIHVLAVVGLILFPVPSLKVVGMTLLSIAFGGLGTTVCYHR